MSATTEPFITDYLGIGLLGERPMVPESTPGALNLWFSTDVEVSEAFTAWNGEQWLQLSGPQGIQGEQGIQGDQGPIGPQGPQGVPSAVVSFNGRIGDVLLVQTDVTGALTYTPYNADTNPANYQSGVQVSNAITSSALLITGGTATGAINLNGGVSMAGRVSANLFTNAANDAAAASAGVGIGEFYRNGSVMMQRVA